MGSDGLRVAWTLGGSVVGLGLGDGVEWFGGGVPGHGGLRVGFVGEVLHCCSVVEESCLIRGRSVEL